METTDRKQPGAWLKPGNYTPWVVGISVVIYVLVGVLFSMPGQHAYRQADLAWMPMVNAILNSFTFVFLLTAYVAIRRKQVERHRTFILAAFATTALFLVNYVAYHYLTESTKYGGTGPLKAVYLIILLTHVLLAAVITPFALFSVVSGLQMNTQRHRKIARWTMPLWLYVSLSGVVVYLMIRPYY